MEYRQAFAKINEFLLNVDCSKQRRFQDRWQHGLCPMNCDFRLTPSALMPSNYVRLDGAKEPRWVDSYPLTFNLIVRARASISSSSSATDAAAATSFPQVASPIHHSSIYLHIHSSQMVFCRVSGHICVHPSIHRSGLPSENLSRRRYIRWCTQCANLS